MTFLQCATAVASTADSLCTAYLLESVGEVYYELHIESHDTPQIGPTSVLFLSTPVFLFSRLGLREVSLLRRYLALRGWQRPRPSLFALHAFGIFRTSVACQVMTSKVGEWMASC